MPVPRPVPRHNATGSVLGVGSCEVDQVIYTASDPASQWRMAGMSFIEEYRYRIGTPSAIDAWDSLTFGSGLSSTAIGFLLSVTSPYDMLFDVETTSGAVTTVQVPGGFAVYRGFTAAEGIVGVTIRDEPSDATWRTSTSTTSAEGRSSPSRQHWRSSPWAPWRPFDEGAVASVTSGVYTCLGGGPNGRGWTGASAFRRP